MADASLEQEIKMAAWPGFELPDLAEVAPGVGVAEAPTLELDAVYVDTHELDLVRRGVSLRRRTGEGATRWTLKLPATAPSGIALSRRELDVVSDAHEVPAELADLVTAWVRRQPLGPVTTIRTTRRRHVLTGADGSELAELDDDEVSVVDADDHVAVRFREIEVELAAGGSPDLLTLVAASLSEAGAGAPDRTTKVVRALGPRALAPPDLAPAEVGPGSTAAELVVAALRASVSQVLDHDHVIRLDDDVEGVHKARVGTRRLRSNLRTFGAVLDHGWADGLRAELAWLAGELGVVRDTDVLLDALWRDVAGLDERDHPVGASVLAHLVDERRRQVAALLTVMRTDRYVDLLEHLVEAAARPRFGPDAHRPAVDVVPGLVAERWRKLRRTARDLGDHPSDDELHRVRILAKRTRYAADAAEPVVGDAASGLSWAVAHLQDELGELHDTAVAMDWLRGLTPRLTHAEAMVAGQLVAAQRRLAAERRGSWRAAWKACDTKALTGWLP
ncbi:CYTH and CHAD domain-containing protein [Rhabdothermincola salaria]|uniref:CYTH and CHAD domain-containing protein n=1 Tax=Rhabdothermincola salaria TaxID=2903142 RepID=UPI001E2A09F2|nr:CYTH and CHAD domain-containing protein [Rhabdothermincola salaria]MCD9625583.1 CYTH and CHAD domain-containing protein [Rhabdothermincola salaria]